MPLADQVPWWVDIVHAATIGVLAVIAAHSLLRSLSTPSDPSSRWLAIWVCVLGGALIANEWVLHADLATIVQAAEVRSILIAASMVLVVPVTAAIAGVAIPWPWFWLAAVSATIRVVLVYTGDTVIRSEPDPLTGAPYYGPLITLSWLPLLVAVAAVVVGAGRRIEPPSSRLVLGGAFALAMGLVVVSFVVSGAVSEVLTGLWIAPLALALAAIDAQARLRREAEVRDLHRVAERVADDLRLSSRRIDRLLAAGRLSWFEFDRRTGVVDSSGNIWRAFEMPGPVPSDLEQYRSVVAEEDWDAFVAALWSPDPAAALVIRVDGPGGLPRFLEIRSVELEDEPDVVGGVTRDITDAMLYRRALEQQAALIELASDAIVVLGGDGSVRSCNPSALERFGWRREEAVGRPMAAVFDDPGVDFEAMFETALRQGEWAGELRWNRNGNEFVELCRMTAIGDEGRVGGGVEVLMVCTDVTALREADDRLHRIQRLETVGSLVSGVAHDVNSLLTPAALAAQQLALRVADDERRLLEIISTAVEHASTVVGQVLVFARGAEPGRTHVDPVEVALESVDLVRATIPTSIEVCVDDLRAGPTVVSANRSQLVQVFVNLLLNARDSMSSGGQVRIVVVTIDEGVPGGTDPDPVDAAAAPTHDRSAQTPRQTPVGSYVEIRVIDTGAGIDPAIRDRLFEPFITTKSSGGGTGLGLSVSRDIVRAHGGDLELQTSTAGLETTFRFVLPVAEAPADQPVVTGDLRPSWPGRGGRGSASRGLVLIVDDEGSIREMARLVLEAYGYRCCTAENGDEAIAALRTHPDVAGALVDLSMPGLDGPATIAALHGIDPGLPILAMTGDPSSGAVDRALAGGARHLLPKPFTVEGLLDALEVHLERVDGTPPRPPPPSR